MKNYIPTYDEAKAMVVAKGELVFYETERFIDGYKVSTFNYRLAQFTDFIKPLTGRKNADAKELRGLCFVFNKDGSLYKRFLMLKKFWNVNQVTETLYENIKDLTIKSIYTKEDGSLISFIKFPNGRVIPKTKMGFDNDQTIEVEKIYKDNKKLRDFVNYCLDNDIVSFWEFVSFKNRIVLNYDKPNLILLKLRDNNTGEYLDIEKYRNKGFDVVKSKDIIDLKTLIKNVEEAKGIEGVVITFDNDYMVKQKSIEYFQRHRLLTEDANREDTIISMILNDTIDDIISQLDEIMDKEQIDFIEGIELIVKDFLAKRIEEVSILSSKYDGNMKDFAIRYKKDKNFGLAINVIKSFEGKDVYAIVKDWLLYQTNKLEKARSFVQRKGFKRK